MDEFVAWFLAASSVNAQGNESCPIPCAITEFPDRGRGLECMQLLQIGDSIVEVPEQLLMTTKSARASSGLMSILSFPSSSSSAIAPKSPLAPLQIKPTILLCLHLLFESHLSSTSFWKPYLDVLPSTYDNFASWQKEDELLLLFPSWIEKCQRAREKAMLQYEEALRFLIPGVVFKPTLDEWIWAVSTISTRGCYYSDPLSLDDKHDSDDDTALVPMADMCNYTPLPPTIASASPGFDHISRTYKFRAGHVFNKGEEALVCYGQHSNLSLLKLYGFCIPNNPHEQVRFSMADVERAVAVSNRVDSSMHPPRTRPTVSKGKAATPSPSASNSTETIPEEHIPEIDRRREIILRTMPQKPSSGLLAIVETSSSADPFSWNLRVAIRLLLCDLRSPSSSPEYYSRLMTGDAFSSAEMMRKEKQSLQVLCRSMLKKMSQLVDENAKMVQELRAEISRGEEEKVKRSRVKQRLYRASCVQMLLKGQIEVIQSAMATIQ